MTSAREKSPTWFYHLYGLLVRTNQPVPHLISASQPEPADLQLAFSEESLSSPQPPQVIELHHSPGHTPNEKPFLKVWRNDHDPSATLGIEYNDGQGYALFHINARGTEARIIRTANLSYSDMVTYLLGPVIGCILRLRQVTCLHAGVVEVDGRAVAIIGPKGAGKSTLVAFLAGQGYSVIADDIAPLKAIDGNYFVSPGYPRLRLWPNTIAALPELVGQELIPILSQSRKRYINLTLNEGPGPWRFQPQPCQLSAIYLLQPVAEETSLFINQQSPASGLLSLIGNVYPHYVLHGSDQARDFTFLSRTAAALPIREIVHGRRLDSLARLSEALLTDFEALLYS